MVKSVVYFVEDEGYIKIGWCKKHNYDAGNNLSELQRGNPRPLRYLAYQEFETEADAIVHESKLHDRFSEHRVHDLREWFYKHDELNEYIRGVVAARNLKNLYI